MKQMASNSIHVTAAVTSNVECLLDTLGPLLLNRNTKAQACICNSDFDLNVKDQVGFLMLVSDTYRLELRL